MTARWATLRALLRIARRDALRARGRSALVVAMIVLPILGMTFADVMLRTSQLDPDEEVTRRLGATSYVLEAKAPPGACFTQAPDPYDGSMSGCPDGGPADGEGELVALAPLVPDDARALPELVTTVMVRTRTGTGEVTWNEVAAADPAFAGRFLVLDGRAPRGPDEVLVTPDLLERTGLAVGEVLELTDPAAHVTVAGTVHEVGSGDDHAVFALPGSRIGAPGGIPADQAWGPGRVFVADAEPLTWQRVTELNELGVSAYDRAIALDPPPREEVPYYVQEDANGGGSGTVLAVVVGVALVVLLAGLEVVLLAGAAFAVGARRQARSLGLLAAAGGTSRHVRGVVLSGGLVLGVVAGVVGVALGIAAAAVAVPLIEHMPGPDLGRFDVRPLEVGAIALLAVVTGVLAAVVPARIAARQDVVAALSGRRGQVATRRRVPVLGVVMAALGVTAAAAGSAAALGGRGFGLGTVDPYLVTGMVAGGAGLALLGLVVLSPAVIGLAGRLGRWLPLTPRLALRDAARHRGRSAPAMAAVLAAVSGSVGLLLYVASIDDHDRRTYQPQLPYGMAGVSLETLFPSGPGEEPEREFLDPEPVQQALAPYLSIDSATVVTTAGDCWDEGCRSVGLAVPDENRCPASVEGREATEAELAEDWRCSDWGVGSYQALNAQAVVGDAELLETLTGVQDPAAAAVLEQGGVVTTDRQYVRDGSVRFEVFEWETMQQSPPPGQEMTWSGPEPDEVVTLPALHVESELAGGVTVLSPEAAERVGYAVVEPSFLLVTLDGLPTQGQEDAVSAALGEVVGNSYFVVERGYTSDYGVGLLALVVGAGVITLGAAGIATGLAQADSRADQATLAAVGADPRLRRNLAGFQALTIAGLGAGLGVLAGLVPGIAFVGALEAYRLVWPWPQLLLVLLGLPAVAGAAAWLLTRSRLPLERRVAP